MKIIEGEFDKSIASVLEKTRINILLGAGASYKRNETQQHYPLMRDLVEEIEKSRIHTDCLSEFPDDSIVRKCYKKMLSEGNFEDYLSSLEGYINYPISPVLNEKTSKLINVVKRIVIDRIKSSSDNTVLDEIEKFYRILLKINNEKEEGLKRINVFTTNYDMLSETAFENIGVHYFSGFFGIKNRRFSPAYYNYSYSDDLNLRTKNYMIKNEHINLYKLHGSVSWKLSGEELVEVQDYDNNFDPVIIYPAHTKYNQTNLIGYYSTLMREFLNQLLVQQSSLIVIGYSFSDEHINKLIESVLHVETFTLIAFAFCSKDLDNLMRFASNRSNVIAYKGDYATLAEIGDFLWREHEKD
jgi:hypothetical protein